MEPKIHTEKVQNNQDHSKEEKNVKALPEKNIYYETIVIVAKNSLVPMSGPRELLWFLQFTADYCTSFR